MANMSYCRFTNTLSDLRDCYEHFDDDLSGDDGMNPEEREARLEMIKLCREIADGYEDELE